MTLDETRELTPNEISSRKKELRQEIFHLRLQQQAGQLEKPHLLRNLRREIARLETVLTVKTKATKAPATR
jgi:large subunit ribosomal protein L29